MDNRTTGTKLLTVENQRVETDVGLNIYSRRWCLRTRNTVTVNRVIVSNRIR